VKSLPQRPDHVVEAFTGADWPEGFTQPLLLALKLHRAAVDRLIKQGTTDPLVKRIDMIKLIERLDVAINTADGEQWQLLVPYTVK